MGWIVSPATPNSYVEALTSNVTIFGHRVSREVIKVKWGHKGGALINRTGVFIRRGRDNRELSLSLCVCTEERPCEDTARRWPSASQEKRPQQKPSLHTP